MTPGWRIVKYGSLILLRLSIIAFVVWVIAMAVMSR
jgi:hypothetical protein